MADILPPHLVYRSRQLWMEGVPLSRIAAEAGSPVYVYSRARLLENLSQYEDAFRNLGGARHLILFAVKANSNGAILSLLGRRGAGADIVSGGELFRARRAGIPPERIVFSGVGKRSDEIRMALEAGILQFNVESVEELQAIDHVSALVHKAAPVAIRVNPDVDAMTHDHITTGKRENKFGIPLKEAAPVFRLAAKLPRISLQGVHVHIGSQITSTRPYAATLEKVLRLVDQLESEGMRIATVDIGGGLGIRYHDEDPPPPRKLALDIVEKIRGRDVTLLLEPGRSLVGDAGILLTRVLYRKDVGAKHFVIVDAAMNDLARPALYDAYHPVFPLSQRGGRRVVADVVGPVCESGDYLARQRSMVLPEPGDGLAVACAGAYGFTMGSQYNSRPRPAEVLVHGTRWTVVREREALEDLVRGERIPGDL